MRLTYKDAIATVLVGFVALAAVAAVRSWGWPLLGSYRAAIGVLALAGLVTCAVAGAGTDSAAKEPPKFRGPLGGVAALLHVAALALVVIGLVAPSAGVVLALAADVAALWLVATVHHAVGQDRMVVAR